jgi:hypothetical protein
MCDNSYPICSTILPIPPIEVFEKAIDPSDRHFLTSYPHATFFRDIGQFNHWFYEYKIDSLEIYQPMIMPPFVIPVVLSPHPVPEPSLFMVAPIVFLSIFGGRFLLKSIRI